MDVDSPSNQPVAAASHETETAIRENTYQEFMQRRKELMKLVHDLPDEIEDLSDGISCFGRRLSLDVFDIEREHPSVQERYNAALDDFKSQWSYVKEDFEARYHSVRQPGTEQPAKLYDSVEEFVMNLKNLEQDIEVAINHPEQAFKKELCSIRQRLEEGKSEGQYLKRKFGVMMEKLENLCKRADELEKLAEQ
ncbi:hypothetical protein H0G86_001745 [Trichoderma simmonsii]|uniref:Uncharacterized protein n=1 Tax=Trichoderma simmonsii TaxID=1491479 RepID=A0A8G0L6V6_9HYPO|nr:hypothetical protein H0G86_001745 [Trichoderma simmonsii]